MKKIIFIVVVLILGFASFKLYEAQISTNENELIFYGNIDMETSNLSFRFLGQISDMKKGEGDKVKKDEEIAKLDDSYLLNKLDELNSQINLNEIKLEKLKKGYRLEEIAKAKANLDIVKAELIEAKSSFNRQSKLIKSNATSQDAYTKSKAKLDMTKAKLELATANYEMLKNGYEKEDIQTQIEVINSLKINADKIKLDIKNHTLTSPIDGVILTKYKEIGEVANPSEAVFEIAKVDDFWVRAYVDEPLLGKIKLGDEMEIFTDLRKEPYKGHISFISTVAEFTPKNVQTQELRADLVYRFKVTFDESDELLKQGMPVHLKLK